MYCQAQNSFSPVDIDTIEIRSDDDTEEAGTIRARRIYNYRVSSVTLLDQRTQIHSIMYM